jgi:hypothetical protein
MDKIINWPLMANPMNWVIVLLMVFIVGLALSLVFQRPLDISTLSKGNT